MDCRVKPGNDLLGNSRRDNKLIIRHIVRMRQFPPHRIVCLTEETVETLYLLGEEARVVGVSGFACRPKEGRSKPRVSAFTSAKIDKILDLHPDLVMGFSNLQADIARDLIRAGVNTLVFNQRS